MYYIELFMDFFFVLFLSGYKKACIHSTSLYYIGRKAQGRNFKSDEFHEKLTL